MSQTVFPVVVTSQAGGLPYLNDKKPAGYSSGTGTLSVTPCHLPCSGVGACHPSGLAHGEWAPVSLLLNALHCRWESCHRGGLFPLSLQQSVPQTASPTETAGWWAACARVAWTFVAQVPAPEPRLSEQRTGGRSVLLPSTLSHSSGAAWVWVSSVRKVTRQAVWPLRDHGLSRVPGLPSP